MKAIVRFIFTVAQYYDLKKNDLLHALIIYTCILHTKRWIKSSCNEQGSHINKYILDNWEFKYYAKNRKNI